MAFFLGSFSCYITDIAATFYTVLMAGEKIQLSSQAASLWLRCGERLSLSLRIEAVTKVFCGSSLSSGNLLHRRMAKLRLRAIVYLPIFWFWEKMMFLSSGMGDSNYIFYLCQVQDIFTYLLPSSSVVWSKIIWRRIIKKHTFFDQTLPSTNLPITNIQSWRLSCCRISHLDVFL